MVKKLVIIPTFNERENISDIIEAIFALEKGFHILVVDDSSPDGTSDIVNSLIPKYTEKLFLSIRQEKNGLGKAYIHGFHWALKRKYDYIFEMDADFSHNPNDLIKLLDTCLEGSDVVVGSRYCNGVNVINWPMGRVLLSYFASKYVRIVLGLPIHDTTAGFLCFSRKVLESIDLNEIKLRGYGFQIEMKFRAFKKGFKIKEIPIVFTDRTKGESKISANIFQEALFGILGLKWKSIINKI